MKLLVQSDHYRLLYRLNNFKHLSKNNRVNKCGQNTK